MDRNACGISAGMRFMRRTFFTSFLAASIGLLTCLSGADGVGGYRRPEARGSRFGQGRRSALVWPRTRRGPATHSDTAQTTTAAMMIGITGAYEPVLSKAAAPA